MASRRLPVVVELGATYASGMLTDALPDTVQENATVEVTVEVGLFVSVTTGEKARAVFAETVPL